MADREVFRFRKNSREVVVVSLREYKGYRLVDCRIYVEGQNGETPTAKGLAVGQEFAGQLLEGLQKALKAIKDEG